MNSNRRQFLRRTGGLVLGYSIVSGLLSLGCAASGDNKSPTGGGKQGDGSCDGDGRVNYANPGHAHTTINMPNAMVLAAVPGLYTLLSGSHDHEFELTAVDFEKLKAGEAITKQETDHGHIVNISC